MKKRQNPAASRSKSPVVNSASQNGNDGKQGNLTPPSISLRSSLRRVSASANHSSSTSKEMESDPAKIRDEVKRILQKFEPKKLEKLEELMSRFKGNELVLLEKMNKRYAASKSD